MQRFRSAAPVALILSCTAAFCTTPEPTASVTTISQKVPAELCGPEAGNHRRLAGTARIRGSLCDVVAVPVATLRGSADGSHPDPGARLVMSSDGRYFTTSAYTRQIIEWDASGAFVRAVGTTGEGPGEFSARGGLILLIDDADSLFVLDGANRWTVLDSDLAYARTFTDDGSGRTVRLKTLEGDSAYWTTPPNGEPQGLSLDRWTIDGSKTHTIRRKAPWLPDDGYGERGSVAGPDLPEYDMLHRTPDGLLWVTVVVRDPRWRPVDATAVRAMERELYDARMEVIDPWSGTVKASYTHDGPPDMIPPFARFLSGTRRSYRMVSDSTTGLSRLEIFDVYLAEKQ